MLQITLDWVVDQAVAELSINGEFVRYVKKQDLERIEEDIRECLTGFKPFSTQFTGLEPPSTYSFDMEASLAQDVIERLRIGSERREVLLDDALKIGAPGDDDSLGKPVVMAYRRLDDHLEYWKGWSNVPAFKLYEILAQDIIEQPYVDSPRDLVIRYNKTAFHVNHGTGHAVRQVQLIRQYFDLIEEKASPTFAAIVQSVSDEEYACLELAAFLFRAGRTNELSWSEDQSRFGRRSAALFTQIASDLGYNPNLVKLVSGCFDYHTVVELTEALDASHSVTQTNLKAQLFKKLLKLTHETDLVRCNEAYAPIHKTLTDTFREVLADDAPHEELATTCLHYGMVLCERTGAPITLVGYLKQENSRIITELANSPAAQLIQLLTFKPDFSSAYTAPTQLWVDSDAHTFRDPLANARWIKAYDSVTRREISVGDHWTQRQMSVIPTELCISLEQEHAQDYVTVYHATTRSSYFLDLLCRKLKLFMDDPESANTAGDSYWIRPINSRPPQERFESVAQMKEIMRSRMTETDNKPNKGWHLLSCSPTLWQNADWDAQESTVHYFFNNSSVLGLKFQELFNTLLDSLHILVDKPDERAAFYEQFKALIADEASYGVEGAIYQFLIPHDLVDEVAYISEMNGIYDPQNPSALETLTKMKTPGAVVAHQDTLQVRLFVPKLLDPSVSSRIILKNHVNYSPAVAQRLDRALFDLASALSKHVSAPQAIASQVTEEASSRSTYSATFWKKPAYVLEATKRPSVATTESSGFDAFDLLSGSDMEFGGDSEDENTDKDNSPAS
jgi:hypothetical protein